MHTPIALNMVNLEACILSFFDNLKMYLFINFFLNIEHHNSILKLFVKDHVTLKTAKFSYAITGINY